MIIQSIRIWSGFSFFPVHFLLSRDMRSVNAPSEQSNIVTRGDWGLDKISFTLNDCWPNKVVDSVL